MNFIDLVQNTKVTKKLNNHQQNGILRFLVEEVCILEEECSIEYLKCSN